MRTNSDVLKDGGEPRSRWDGHDTAAVGVDSEAISSGLRRRSNSTI